MISSCKISNHRWFISITLMLLTYLQPALAQNCSAGSFFNGTNCFNCPINTYSIGDTTNCTDCTNCLACNSTNGICTLCQSGYGTGMQICTPCNDTSFSNGTEPCTNCSQGCAACNTSNGYCATCNPAYGLSNDGNQCIACFNSNSYSPGGTVPCTICNCTSGCNAITGVCSCGAGFQPVTGGCQACSNNTYSDGNRACINCQEGCVNCNSQNGGCPSCMTGYVHQPVVNGQCILCNISNCTNCTTANVCEACTGQLVPNSNNSACVNCNVTNCSICSSNYYCQSCISSYLPLNNICTLCGVAYCSSCNTTNTTQSINISYQCAACAKGYVLDIAANTCSLNCTVTNCSYCSTANECAACNSGFTLQNNICYPNCGISECINCKGFNCNQCANNYTLIGTQNCLRYCNIQFCIQCDDYGYCLACANGLNVSADGSACVQCNVTNCLYCGLNGSCDICSGNLLRQINGECLECNVDNCYDCGSDNNCSSTGCYNGYFFNPEATNISDQCLLCLDPCETCFANGSCITCIFPYSVYPYPSNSSCFFCADSNCVNCTSPYSGNCSACVNQQYRVINGSCVLLCSTGCQICNVSACITCQIYFYMQPNNTCAACSYAPDCTACNPTNNSICTSCNIGFLLFQGNCLPCSSYCATCSSLTFCLTLLRPAGLALVSTASINNSPASCDPGCYACSTINPTLCSSCLSGYYLYSPASSSTTSYCIPCEPNSYCSSCSPANPTFCTSCYSGSFLSSQNICIQCLFPCTSCSNRQASNCTACAIGYILSSSICLSIATLDTQDSTALQNCANAQVYNDPQGNAQYVCSLCLQGYTQTGYGCAPCLLGCLICNPNDLTACIQCAPGFYLNTTTGICIACDDNCQQCTPTVGCLSCANGYYLTRIFICQPNCIAPCITCLVSPYICTSCVQGYTLTDQQCQPDTSCNKDAKCQVCPYGYALIIKSTAAKFNQTCTACTNSSNCARCNTSNLTQCTSCTNGFYLNNSICLNCSTGCANCLSPFICFNCSIGFVPLQSGTVQGNLAVGNRSCARCTSPCLSCVGSVTTCTACLQNYTLQGGVCLSNFNYQVNATLLVSLATFQANYLAYLNQLTAAAGINVQNCVVPTISAGSVFIVTQLSVYSLPNTPPAINAQNALNNMLNSGTVASMKVGTFSFGSNGGSNNDTNNDTNNNSSGGSGLPTSTIIILATVIPIGTILIAGTIVIIYCIQKRRKKQQMGLNSKSKDGQFTGRTIEMSIGQNKQIQRAYL